MSGIPLFASLLLVLLLNLSCDESLPSYSIPATIFESSISPLFVKTRDGPRLWVYLTVKNTFDETLQDTASLVGSLEIILARDQSIRKTVAFNRNYIYRNYPYPSTPSIDQNNILTFNSGDSLTFLYQWNFMSDNNIFLPQQVFTLTKDPNDPTHLTAAPETFIVRGSVQIFSRIGQVIFEPIDYILYYEQG
jgi:hypothetical protein